MSDYALTVRAERLFFYYVTPKKVPLFRGCPLPLQRVTREKCVALHEINFRMRSGRITALLGRNGSGKTTLIKIISGLRIPQGGEIEVFGLAPKLVRHRMGVCAGSSLIYNRLTARENLEYFGKLYQVFALKKRIQEMAELLNFESTLDQMVESFSFGMKAKLALARAMIHSPDFLILDEPTLGIDIEIAAQIRTFVRSLKCTVLLTTHYMEEAEQLADDLCIIEQGKIVSSGTKAEVLADFKSSTVVDAFTRAVIDTSDMRAAS